MWLNGVSPGYFRTLGIPLRRGRDFTDADGPGSAPVAIVSESAARRLRAGKEVLGSRFRFAGEPETVEVVGVATDSKWDEPMEAPVAAIYLPLAQRSVLPKTTAFVRSGRRSIVTPRALEAALRPLDPSLPLFDGTTLPELVGRRLDRQTAIGTLLGWCGFAGLLIAVIGLYGVVSQAVLQRAREIGVRVALGASTRLVTSLVVGGGMRLAAAGIGLGALLSAPVGLFLARAAGLGLQVEGLLSLAVASTALATTTFAATLLPARRAARIDPRDVLL